MKWVRIWIAGAALWAGFGLGLGPVRGDQLVLKDGTVLKGTVMKSGERYWVDKEGGGSQFVPVGDVKEWVRDGGGGGAAAGGGGGEVKGTTVKFAAARNRAERMYTATAAVGVWEEFIKTQPSDADLAAANAELARWQKLAADGAESINGKWLSGAERKKIVEQAEALFREGDEAAESDRMVVALQKFEAAVKVYPNFYEANSLLGLLSMMAKKDEDAQKYFMACLRLRPEAVDALNNMAVLQIARGRWEEGVRNLTKALEKQDSITVTANLMKALQTLPREHTGTAWAKAARGPADLLAAKYGLARIPDWRAVRYRYLPPVPRPPEALAGMVSGSGFVVSADGMILTNRHVVHKTTALWVVIDNKRVPAEVVKEDTELDLALVRLKGGAAASQPAAKLTPVELARTEVPAEGAQCFVVGYPLASRLGTTLKVTQGIVSGSAKAPEGVDVLIDAKVNPGNSGGPLLNKNGQVIGIVSMKSETTGLEDSYGMAISVGKVRKFLEANKVVAKLGEAGPALGAEEVVARVKGGTVCILGQVR